MLAMAVVSWEILSRLNLYSCFGMALTCLYVAATLSRDLTLGLFLLLFLGLLLAFLWQADSEDGVKDNPTILKRDQSPATAQPTLATNYRSWAGRIVQPALRFAPAILVAGALVFIVTPHFASSPIIPPITLRLPVNKRPSAQIVNPALPVVQIEGIVDPNAKSDYYYGFDSGLDLSYRGGLTDTIMMYVRSPAASYWRSHAYDHYDGRTWTQSDSSLTPIQALGGRYLFNLVQPAPSNATLVQSFFIAQPLPNVIFVGGKPARLLFPAEEISRDSTDGLRAPEPLEVGTQYTVYSSPQNWSAAQLRRAPSNYPDSIRGPYLQIPPSTPSRVFDLARQITTNSPTAYDKAVALRDYLKANYPYDYFPPPQAPNTDSVDQFLFVDKRGVCEHYVSALVIMLRSLGIPSRLVAGYGTGTYNAITGYYEVHANDAHAWAEVYFPGNGWVPFDPTPGWNGDPQTGPVQTWIFSSFTDQVDLPKLPVGEIASAGITALSGFARPLLALLLIGFLVLAAWVVGRFWKDYARRHPPRPTALRDHLNRRRILATYRQAQRTLRSPRAPGQTVNEHAATRTELADLAQAVDVAAYRPEPPDEATVQKARHWKK
jgi:transglutaminase-like putative cysteine protease